jgi:alginate O-acetyltransferase complex protein AlgI
LLFPTITFVVFFVVVFACSWGLAGRRRAWRVFMLVACYFFYSFWGWRFALLLAGMTVFTDLFARLLGAAPRKRRWLLALAVVVELLPLAFYKYYGFLALDLSALFGRSEAAAGLPFLQLAIPVGISFTSFRAVSYIVDCYRGDLDPASLLDTAIYLSFFPYIAAGPITRGHEVLPQFRSLRKRPKIDATRALYLICMGLAKKVIIGDFLARTIVDGVFSTPGQYSSLDVIVGIHAYAVQIYCDFSGYTDMAIGIALLLGITLPINFDRPYTAASVREFWRRWHMTLSRWLRDYLYIPLGGSRCSQPRMYFNILVTMVLAGLWHGAGWTFLVWGGMHGAAQAVEHGLSARQKRLAARRKRRGAPEPAPGRAGRVLRHVLTFEFVCLAWVFFRADSVSAAGAVIVRTFTAWGEVPTVGWLVLLAVAVGIGFQYLPGGVGERIQAGLSRVPFVAQGLAFGLVLFAIVGLLGGEGISRFIYMGF